MRGRDRLFGTVAIWVAVAVMMNNLLDRLLRITADFSGLWPPINFVQSLDPNTPTAITGTTLDDFNQTASAVSTRILAEVNDVLARQASNIPVMVILALALILAATLSTYFIWRNAHLETDAPARSKQAATGKSKRGSRVEQVVNALDDDEIAELRARLMSADDGEAIPLETLLAQRDEAYRR